MIKKPHPLHPNLLDPNQAEPLRRRIILFAVLFSIFIAGLATIGASASYRASTKGISVLTELGTWPAISELRKAVFGEDDPLQKTQDDRLTFLLLGIGGEGHDGPELTDTVLLTIADLKQKKVALLSIPRDMAYPLGGGAFEKINALNAYAEQTHPGEGAKRTADALAKLFETPIQHVVRMDFRGFTKFVDALGGIDIAVERSFTDTEFPARDGTPSPISFKAGPERMDGATALAFVRSRHGTNNEGSDFARSRRQQLVLLAIKDRLLSLGTLTDPRKISSLWSAVATHIQTDLSPWDFFKLAPLLSEFSRDQIVLKNLSDAPDGGLMAANVSGAYMLFPKKPDWSEIREIIRNPFAATTTSAALAKTAEPVRLEIKNGTARIGFASQIAAKLEKEGYDIAAFGNAARRGFERTLIFDLTGGKRSAELAALRRRLGADISVGTSTLFIANTSTDPVKRLVYTDKLTAEPVLTSADFLIILGEASLSVLQE